MSVKFIHTVYSSSLPFLLRYSIPLYEYTQFIHSVVDGNLSFQSLAVTRKQACFYALYHRKGSKWDITCCSDNCFAKDTSNLQLDLVLWNKPKLQTQFNTDNCSTIDIFILIPKQRENVSKSSRKKNSGV